MPDWRERLGLGAHPEGGFFRRIRTSPRVVHTVGGPRPTATSIQYLLTRDEPRGRLHLNRSDILHFLLDGGPVEYVTVTPAGALDRVTLRAGERHFLAVPGGVWKASHLVGDATHALVAEVVPPGFDYADHRFAVHEDFAHLPALREEPAPFLP
ncbi:cupin domain-containing protein [Streptomyces somaliensis]|uniref:Cupin domain-containing protein n=1 Tax=Streptomyces somaliensis (strain ATCC 33201 / DSM 40738 / JCM 12659 / KCTC 9044 / NCTC 11332 / NRRL B-12077 / IP 733) TaxID=1134445 RepID=A0AA44DFE3_STRE0|nr:cupin domain-containing protein [Streptomyces somaliensis]NKY15634.1 cupin domain-containing protein [Streptomyces somaliensis DSM 40738]